MAKARFCFHGELVRFLAPERRSGAFSHECARAATLKNAIESLGVPHTEAGRLVVNGWPATLDRIVRENDAVEIFPHEGGSAGDEPLLTGEAADAVRAKARQEGYGGREIFHADRWFEWPQLLASCQSLSLFAERRIVELRMPAPRPGKEGGEMLARLAADPPPDTSPRRCRCTRGNTASKERSKRISCEVSLTSVAFRATRTSARRSR